MQNHNLHIRKAEVKDILSIVRMLADDPLGSQREAFKDPLPQSYCDAFHRIDNDNNQELMVVESADNQVIGTCQLTFIPYLTYQGGIRAQIEAVRIDKKFRGKGIGKMIIEWAVNRARKKGAHVIQLTTDRQRPQAISFYEQLGFNYSHAGFKRHL